MRQTLNLRIDVEHPVPGVAYALQIGSKDIEQIQRDAAHSRSS